MARTILIVEDDRALAGTLEIGLLALTGVDTVTVFDGRAAMDYLESHRPPALVLTDLDLPRVDGYALIAWVRTHPELRSLPIIAMSARDDGTGARQAGANDFLMKPFPLAAVRTRVQECMDA
ncbi:MAG TPA: response regulator [Bryobacteraceae bacterium]|nr:response regulator [Bryobacteraceae bacterium]